MKPPPWIHTITGRPRVVAGRGRDVEVQAVLALGLGAGAEHRLEAAGAPGAPSVRTRWRRARRPRLDRLRRLEPQGADRRRRERDALEPQHPVLLGATHPSRGRGDDHVTTVARFARRGRARPLSRRRRRPARHLGAVGNDGGDVVEVAEVVGADEHVHVGPQDKQYVFFC